MFHAQMASERGLFDLDDVANTMSDKMVARHPHVFGNESNTKSAEQQTQDWETIKAAERAGKRATRLDNFEFETVEQAKEPNIVPLTKPE